MLKWLWISGVVILIDQVTKVFADKWLTLHEQHPVISGFFNLTLAYNEGAAFSFLNDAGGWQRWLFTALALVVSAVIIVWIKRLAAYERWTAIALCLILGGAIGNVIDRILYGHVIDFIQWYYSHYYWPAFNIADSAISIGAVMLIVHSLFTKEQEGPSRV